MKRRIVGITLALALGVAFGLAPESAAAATKSEDLRAAMRRLWEDHVTWTRLYIVSALADLPDLEATTDRLLRNQKDIGDAVKPFYGDAAGEKLTGLLRQHILIAADIVGAAKAGDQAKLDAGKARWASNADEIAAFLSGANPGHWRAADMRAMMREHLDLTTAELVARLHKDWSADAAAYDRIHAQILKMADMLAAGIAAQFPEKVG